MSSSMGSIIPYIMENKRCSKPPIQIQFIQIYYKSSPFLSKTIDTLIFWYVHCEKSYTAMGVTENQTCQPWILFNLNPKRFNYLDSNL
jgi:hypothetical protein